MNNKDAFWLKIIYIVSAIAIVTIALGLGLGLVLKKNDDDIF